MSIFWGYVLIIITNILALIGVLFALFYAISTVATVVTMPMVFKKANQPWWSCFVPVLNAFALVKIAELPKSYALALVMLPIVTPAIVFLSTLFGISFWIFTIIGILVYLYLILVVMTEIASQFGFSTLYAVICTFFLQGFFFSLMIFSNANYEGSGEYGSGDNYFHLE